MNDKFKSLILVITFMASLTVQPIYGQSDSQRKPVIVVERYLSSFPNNRGIKGCYPAEVTAVSQTTAPPEGLEVVIKNFSWKIINAVKIGWYIAEDEDRRLAGRLLKVPCDAPPLPDEIVLSGETPLIETGSLHPLQTAAIGKRPLKMLYETQDRIVLTDSDFITMDEVKDLTTDGTPKTFKKIYTVIMAVSEIQFADGSVWKPEAAPIPLTPSSN